MVDAAGTKPRAVSAQTAEPALRAAVLFGAEAIAAHRDACAGLITAPPQHPLWVAAYIEHAGEDAAVCTIFDGSTPVFSLPVEFSAFGPVRMARFLSGSHANGNFPVIRKEIAGSIRPGIETLQAALRDQGCDLLALERQAPEMAGMANPFLTFSHHESPDPALAVTLDGGFDTVLDRTSGKRKRKKHRAQRRKFEAWGGYRRFCADTPEAVEMLLNSFFAMKAARFQQLGIADRFAGQHLRAFFRSLFTSALDLDPKPFFLCGLEVGGKLRAVTGSSRCGERIICEFSAFADDEVAAASPGDFLFYEDIKAACEEGMAVFDFSVGDETYKRQWCDQVNRQFDCLVPLTAKGRAAAMAYRTTADAKRTVKSNDALWSTVKQLRRSLAGR